MKNFKHWLATMAALLCGITASAQTTYPDWKSGYTSHGGTKSYAYTINVGDNYVKKVKISFNWSVSSEAGFDKMIVSLDGTIILTESGEKSGTYSVEINHTGTSHELVVKYVKDNSNSVGSDCCTISNIEVVGTAGICGDNITWTLQSNGELVLEGTGDMTRAPWGISKSFIKKVTISNGITSICVNAFTSCSNLVSISVPESITEIADNALLGTPWYENQADGLVYVGRVLYKYKGTMPTNTLIDVVDGTISISEGAFEKCSGLASIVIPESVTTIGEHAFSGCSSLKEVAFEDGKKPISLSYNVMGHEASDNYDEDRDGEGLFFDCPLENVFLGRNLIYDGGFVYGMSPFYNNDNIKSITVGESVTSIGYALFSDCNNLTSIVFSEGLTSISEFAFSGCEGLTSIIFTKNIESIAGSAFAHCENLASITCQSICPPTVSHDYYISPFYGVSKDIPVYVPAPAISAYQGANIWNEFKNIQGIPETLTISEYGSGTYCSPYALDFSEVEGLKAYAATGYDSETGVVTLTRVMTAKAGMGLFVKGEPGDYVVPTLESTSFNTLNMLVGTLEDVIVNGTDGLYTNYKYAAPDGEPLFYQFADGSTHKAGRAYLQIPTSWLTTTAAKSISYRFDDGETTDIENSEFTTPNSEFIYDLYGRRVENPIKGGVYIVKGKKIVY